jgi:hypothetical protein
MTPLGSDLDYLDDLDLDPMVDPMVNLYKYSLYIYIYIAYRGRGGRAV